MVLRIRGISVLLARVAIGFGRNRALDLLFGRIFCGMPVPENARSGHIA
jgi:hypothetical protein